MKMLSLLLLNAIIYTHAMERKPTIRTFVYITEKKVYCTNPQFFKIAAKNNGNINKINLEEYTQEDEKGLYILTKLISFKKQSIPPRKTRPKIRTRISLCDVNRLLKIAQNPIPTPPPLPVGQQSLSLPS